jgi:hypothetical protein
VTVRKVTQFQQIPGLMADSGAGLEVLGVATEDHEHSYDEGYKLVDGVDIFPNDGLGNSGWTPETGSNLDPSTIACYKLGNQVYFEGWLKDIHGAGWTKLATILTIPIGFRPSPENLPQYFRVLYKEAGVNKISTLRLNDDFILRWATPVYSGALAITDVQLKNVRYMLK